MEFSIKFDIVKSGWSIVYIEEFKNNIIFIFLKIDFVLEKSADPDELLHYAAFHLSLH